MSDCQNLKAVIDVPEDDTVITNPQPMATPPLAMHRFNISTAGSTEVRKLL